MASIEEREERRQRMSTACRSGDIPALKNLIRDADGDPEKPAPEWPSQVNLTGDPARPALYYMVHDAVCGQQIETLRYLAWLFPGCASAAPMTTAVRSGNYELIETLCKLDHSAANGEDDYTNVLACACSEAKDPKIVKLLLEHGADPNRRLCLSLYTDFYCAAEAGLPASIVDDFFDAGWSCCDKLAVEKAVEMGRVDSWKLSSEEALACLLRGFHLRRCWSKLRKGTKTREW